MEEAKSLKAAIKVADDEAQSYEERLLATASLIPNDSHPLSPIGAEPASVQLALHGPSAIPASSARHHVSLNESLHFMDLESGITSTGSSWSYLTGLGASLELALINYAMSIALSRGFSLVMTPDVVRSDIADRCGFQPKQGEASQNYHISSPPGLVMSGTAEIPLGAMFANKLFDHSEVPKKVVGLGRAFRAEAGARGADTRGLYRLHQFSKVELFAVTAGDPAVSESMMEEMRGVQEEINCGLGLTFRYKSRFVRFT
jgi:seryl-tRNA synthetase